ncbi:MAG: hypothetical protein AAF328_05730 [Planctomycetota bacterium]
MTHPLSVRHPNAARGLRCCILLVGVASAPLALGQATPVQRIIGEPDAIEGFDLNVIGSFRGTSDGAVAVRGTDLSFMQTVPFPANGGARIGIVIEPPDGSGSPVTPSVALQGFDFTPTNASSPIGSLNIADDRTLAYRNTDAAGDPLLFLPAGGSPTTILSEGDALDPALNLPGATWDQFGLVRFIDQDTFVISGEYTDGTVDTYAPQNVTGTRFDQGVFKFDNGTWTSLVQTGDTLAGLTGPESVVSYARLDGSTFNDLGSIGVSADGERWIGVVDVDPSTFRPTVNPFPVRNQLLVDSAAVTNAGDGSLLQEDLPVPAALVDGETGFIWEDFFGGSINSQGDWVVAGQIGDGTATDSTIDEVLILRGSGDTMTEVLYRPGDSVPSDLGDDATFVDTAGRLAINEDGDIAAVWGDSVFVNGREVAGIGSEVLDAAGDPTSTTLGQLNLGLTLSERTDDGELVIHFSGRLPGETLNQSDIYRLVLTLEGGIPGDYDDSGSVEQGDLNLVLNNWGQDAPFEPNGDPFATLAVDQEELNRVLNNWGNTAVNPDFTGFSVPEPTSALLLSLTAFARRRSSSCERPWRDA